MKNIFVWIVIGVIIIVGVVWYLNRASYAPPSVPTPTPQPTTEVPASVTVNVSSQNNSGESGTATLTVMEGKTHVTLALIGAPASVTQPAHIHTGSCAAIGGVKYPLTFPVDGTSETMLDISLQQLLSELPLAINVHKSPQEASVYVACGDIAY